MRKLIFLLIPFLIFTCTTLYSYSSDPKEFIVELVEDAISKLSDKDLTDEEKSLFIEQIALENVDIKALGLYTLGELRKSTEKEKINNYQIAFEKYFSKAIW